MAVLGVYGVRSLEVALPGMAWRRIVSGAQVQTKAYQNADLHLGQRNWVAVDSCSSTINDRIIDTSVLHGAAR